MSDEARPLAQIRRGADGTTDCWFHGPEPVTDETFIVCFECGHAWTRSALEDEDFRGQQAADIALAPDASTFTPQRRTAEDIGFCPECIHDF